MGEAAQSSVQEALRDGSFRMKESRMMRRRYCRGQAKSDLGTLHKGTVHSPKMCPQMKRPQRLLVMLLFLSVTSSPLVLAEDVAEGRKQVTQENAPILILGKGTEKLTTLATEDMLTIWSHALASSLKGIPASIQDGLLLILQSPQRNYKFNENLFFVLRLLSASKDKPVILHRFGILKIRVLNLDSQEVILGLCDIEKNLDPSPEYGKDVVPVGLLPHAIPEMDYFLTLDDFYVGPLPRGKYQIRLTYSNQLEDFHCWTGELNSNPIEVEIK